MTADRDDGYFEYTFPREDLAPPADWAPPPYWWRYEEGRVYIDWPLLRPGRLRSVILASAIAGLCVGVALTIAAYSFGVLP